MKSTRKNGSSASLCDGILAYLLIKIAIAVSFHSETGNEFLDKNIRFPRCRSPFMDMTPEGPLNINMKRKKTVDTNEPLIHSFTDFVLIIDVT